MGKIADIHGLYFSNLTIIKGRGNQFDPDMVDAFLQIHEQFKSVAITFADSETLLSASKQKK